MSVPLKPLFRCDKQCSEKTLSYWQLASVELNEGDEAYTTGLCQKCSDKHLQVEGENAADKCAVETGGGEEGVSWKNVENDGERTKSAWDVGTFSPAKDRRRGSFGSWLTKKSRQECKVSGSKNRQPKNTWNK